MEVKLSQPLLPLRDIVVFPSMVIPLFVGRDKSISAVNEVMKNDKKIILVTQKNSEIDLEKHSAFHNLGNSYMKKKDYAQAVEAYKNALRNNSADDETRYNYALAKKFLEGDKRQNSENSEDSEEEKQDQSEDQNENQDENQNSDQNSESEKEKPKDQDDKKEQEQGGGLSKQQMDNLLEAVNNIEKDLNEKLKSGKKKLQTTKKSEKDW